MRSNNSQIFRRVAFFGKAHLDDESQTYKDAYKAAKLLAENGYAVVNGGGPGVMNASTQGAKEGGGEVVAVTFAPKLAESFEGRYLKNLDAVTRERVTNNYIDRMFGLIEESDIFVIFRGGSGTMSEFGTVWVLANIYHGHHKPFILYGSHWWEVIEVLHRTMLITEQEMRCFKIVESREELLAAIERLEMEFANHEHAECGVCGERVFMK